MENLDLDIYRFPKLNYEEIIIVFLSIVIDFCLVICGFTIVKTACQSSEPQTTETQKSKEELAESPENVLTAKTTVKSTGKTFEQ